MNIGQAAILSGLPVKTLRYYEEIGLVRPKRCDGNDYRDYSTADVEHLRFLQRSRAVGFSLEVCRELLELYRDENRRCAQARTIILEKIEQIENQMQELDKLKSVLTQMANACIGEGSTDNSLIENLPQSSPAFMPFTLVESHE